MILIIIKIEYYIVTKSIRIRAQTTTMFRNKFTQTTQQIYRRAKLLSPFHYHGVFFKDKLKHKMIDVYLIGVVATFESVLVGNTMMGGIKMININYNGNDDDDDTNGFTRPFLFPLWGLIYGFGFGMCKAVVFTPIWPLFWFNAWYEHYHGWNQINSPLVKTLYLDRPCNTYHIMRHFIPNSNYDIQKNSIQWCANLHAIWYLAIY